MSSAQRIGLKPSATLGVVFRIALVLASGQRGATAAETASSPERVAPSDNFTDVDGGAANVTNRTTPTSTPRRSADGHCDSVVNFVTYSLLAGVLCLLGFAGNSVSYVVLRMDSDSRVAGFLLQTLACTDNLFLAAWFLHFTLNEAFGYFGLLRSFHVAWLYVRVYTYPLLFITQTGTIWLTVLIAASRYVAVCRPYSASRYCSLPVTKKVVAAIAAFSVAYNLPRFFEVQIVPRRVGRNRTRVVYALGMTQFGESFFYRRLYFDVLYIVVTFVLPLMMLLFLNTRLVLAYRVIQRRRRTMRMRHEQHDHSITLVMIMVVLLFLACNAPARVVQMIWRYEAHRCPSTSFFMISLSNVLEVLNSSSNFIIYCVFRKQFRRNLRRRLCPGGGRAKAGAEAPPPPPPPPPEAAQLNGSARADCERTLIRKETTDL